MMQHHLVIDPKNIVANRFATEALQRSQLCETLYAHMLSASSYALGVLLRRLYVGPMQAVIVTHLQNSIERAQSVIYIIL